MIENGIVLVDFYADWCGPCKMMGPVLENIKESRSDIKVVKINVDENEDMAKKYGVMSIPTLILFKDGNLLSKKIGYTPEITLTQWINENI